MPFRKLPAPVAVDLAERRGRAGVVPRATDALGTPYLPELAAVVDRAGLLITRPWVEWARRITANSSGGPHGDVNGPASAESGAIVLFDGVSGKAIKDSGLTIPELEAQIVAQAETAILPVDLANGAEVVGILPAARLPPEAARRDQGNTFVGTQEIRTPNPLLAFTDPSAAAGTQRWRVVRYSSAPEFRIEALTDDNTAIVATPLLLDRAGNATIGQDLYATRNVVAQGGFLSGVYAFLSSYLRIAAPNPYVQLEDTAQPSNARQFRTIASGQLYSVRAVDDTGGVQATPLQLTRTGDANVGRDLYTGRDAYVSGAAAVTNQVNAGGVNVHGYAGDVPRVTLTDGAQPANARVFQLRESAQVCSIAALDDAWGLQTTPLAMNRAGDVVVGRDVYEKGRGVALGTWQAVPYNAANFSGLSGMTWTVASGNVSVNRYTLIGKTLIWNLQISSASIGGTLSYLLIAAIPAGFTLAAVAPSSSAQAQAGGVEVRAFTVAVDGTHVGFQQTPFANWAASAGNANLSITITLEIT